MGWKLLVWVEVIGLFQEKKLPFLHTTLRNLFGSNPFRVETSQVSFSPTLSFTSLLYFYRTKPAVSLILPT